MAALRTHLSQSLRGSAFCPPSNFRPYKICPHTKTTIRTKLSFFNSRGQLYESQGDDCTAYISQLSSQRCLPTQQHYIVPSMERMSGNYTPLHAAQMISNVKSPITSTSYILDNACVSAPSASKSNCCIHTLQF